MQRSYDPITDAWPASKDMLEPAVNATAILLLDGQVLVIGPGYIRYSQLYDPVADTWSSAPATIVNQLKPTATLLPNGKVLVVGGSDGVALTTAELYDPVTNTWSLAASMGTARWGHTATLLPDGRVFVAGGTSDTSPNSCPQGLSSAELYDPVSNTWTPTASMGTERWAPTATLLPNGKVLVAGGAYNTSMCNVVVPNTSAELYDPVAGTWTPAARMETGRYLHTATLLPNGKVLIAGGYSGTDAYYEEPLASTELYDPARDSWLPAANMAIAQAGQDAILLTNSSLLVVGGSSSACCELYLW